MFLPPKFREQRNSGSSILDQGEIPILLLSPDSDAVDLHEAEPLDQAEQAGPGQLGRGRRAQPLQMQVKPPRPPVGKQAGHGLLYRKASGMCRL